MDELALAAETDRAVSLALHRLDNPPKQPRSAPVPTARMPSTYSPPRPWTDADWRWFAAASSITRQGAMQCASC